MPVEKLFPTLIQKDQRRPDSLDVQMLKEVRDLVDLDSAGIAWSKSNYKNGFTSYASANQLHRFSSTFQKLERWIDLKVAAYAKRLDLDLGGASLKMTNCWANVMYENTHHSLHLHPLSVISGTYYLSMPPGAAAIKFEDPRLSCFMHAPPRKENCRRENKNHIQMPAKAGTLVLFESWIRHEVPIHAGKRPRISVSFNYGWE